MRDGVQARYGPVQALYDVSLTVAEAIRSRRVSLPHYRGRSTLAFPVQAAEVLIRQYRYAAGGFTDFPMTFGRPRSLRRLNRTLGSHAHPGSSQLLLPTTFSCILCPPTPPWR